MSAATPEPTAPATVTPPPATDAPTTPPEGAEPKVFDADYVKGLRAEAAKYRTEAKANADAAKKLAEIEEANKSEAQKLADQLATAKSDLLTAKREAFAATKGVPSSSLTGSTPEEWEAAAAALLAWKGDAPKPPVAPSAAGQGKVGEPVGAGATQLTADDVKKLYAERKYAEIEKARTEGRLNSLLG